MPIIKSVKAIEIIDSRANPTLKVYVETESGAKRSACFPSGASTGIDTGDCFLSGTGTLGETVDPLANSRTGRKFGVFSSFI